jgi:hypothetical protein
MRNKWVRKLGFITVAAALLFVSWALGVAVASPAQNPFTVIESKLDQVLAALSFSDPRGVTQNWDKKLNSTNGGADGCNSDRFTCIFGGQAVRDNETGLVWERSPHDQRDWEDAVRTCWQRKVGDRMGWRLPTVEQLASLVDPNAQQPALPPGHPFVNIQTGNFLTTAYWSSTTDVRTAFLPDQAWEVRFANGSTGDSGKQVQLFMWCVRGQGNANTF